MRFSADSGAIHREQAVILSTATPPELGLEVVPGLESVAPGGTAKFGVFLLPNSGLTGPVKLGVRNLPAGAVAVFEPSDTLQVSSGKASAAALLVQTTASTPTGDYPLVISADASGISRQKTVTLRVLQLEGFTLSAAPLSRTIPPGGVASYELTLTSIGVFSGAVGVSTGNLPPGVTAHFTPDETVVLVPGSSVKLIVTLAAAAGTPTGAYVVDLRAKSGAVERQTMVRLGIEGNASFALTATELLRFAPPGSAANFPLTLTSLDKFSRPVNLMTAGAPAGVSVTLVPASPILLGPGQSIGMTAQVLIGPSVPEGKYPIQITASSAGASSEALVVLWVTAERGYYLDATPDFRETSPGNPASYTLKLTSIGDYSGSVALSALGLPAGATAQYQPNGPVLLRAGQTQRVDVTVLTTAATPVGMANLKFNADSGSLHKEDTVTLNVVERSGIRLELAPSSRMTAPGGSATYLLTVWSMGGFAGPVNLSVRDLAAGFTGALDPGSLVELNAGGVEVVEVTVQVPEDAGAGSYRFQIQGIARGAEASIPGRVVVDTENTVRLHISPHELSLAREQTGTFTVSVQSDGYHGPVILSVVGLPPGMAVFSPAGPLMIRPGERMEVELFVRPGVNASMGVYRFAVLADTSTHRVAEVFGKLFVVGGENGADFSMVVSPVSRTVNSGATAVYKVWLTSVNGYRGSVDLSVRGFPPGEVKWEPGDSIFLEAGATRSATLLIKTEKGAEEKVYHLLFVANSGDVHHQATASMTVVKTPSEDEDDEDEGHHF